MLPFYSVKDIMEDLKDCIQFTNLKVAKRLARLEVICGCLGREVPADLVPAVEVVNNADPDTIREFVKRPACSTGGEVVLRGTTEESVKRAVEASLTSALNVDIRVYMEMLLHTYNIINALKYDALVGPLMEFGDVKFAHKGGIATRLVLLASFPERSAEICEKFGLGGDNDCGIVINPRLVNFDAVHAAVVSIVQKYMLDEQQNVDRDTAQLAERVKSVEVAGITFGVKPARRGNFAIRADPNGSTIANFSVATDSSVFFSRNDALRFTDGGGNPVHFALLRWKRAFSLDLEDGTASRPFGAEMLDIAIPYSDDRSAAHFGSTPMIMDPWGIVNLQVE